MRTWPSQVYNSRAGDGCTLIIQFAKCFRSLQSKSEGYTLCALSQVYRETAATQYSATLKNIHRYVQSQFRPGPSNRLYLTHRSDRRPFQTVLPQHHLWQLMFFYESLGRCCSLWGQPDWRSHLHHSHLGKISWGPTTNCHRTAWTTNSDLWEKFVGVQT